MILLIRPNDSVDIFSRLPASINKAQGIYPPLGIAYLASNLKKHNFDVAIYDMEAESYGNGYEDLKNMLKKYNPDFVGVTAMTPTVLNALGVLKEVKKYNNNIKTIIGGTHLSIYPQETVQHEFVDYGVIGEGEYAIIDILNGNLQAKGLVYKKDNKVIINERREPNRNLNELPFPARELMPNEKYNCILMNTPMTTMLAARGCPFNCAFCYKDDYLHYRSRSAENVFEEIKEFVKVYGIKEFAFYNDCFPNKKWVADLCERLINNNIKVKWETPQRIDLVDKDLLKLMKKAGCQRLKYGVESGNQDILNLMNKRTKIEDIKKVFKLTKEVGIETFGYFIIGYYGENENTIRDSINLAKELNPDWVAFNVGTPLPNTKFMDDAVASNIVDKDYWKKHTLGCQQDRIPYMVKDSDKHCEQAYREFYLRYQYIFKRVMNLRNAAQLERCIRGGLGLIRFKML